MKRVWSWLLDPPTTAPPATILIRTMAGSVFLSGRRPEVRLCQPRRGTIHEAGDAVPHLHGDVRRRSGDRRWPAARRQAWRRGRARRLPVRSLGRPSGGGRASAGVRHAAAVSSTSRTRGAPIRQPTSTTIRSRPTWWWTARSSTTAAASPASSASSHPRTGEVIARIPVEVDEGDWSKLMEQLARELARRLRERAATTSTTTSTTGTASPAPRRRRRLRRSRSPAARRRRCRRAVRARR